MRKINFEEREKSFYKWIVDHRYRVMLVMVLAIIFMNISNLPYLNLVFNKDINILILVVVAILMFNLRVYDLFKMGAVLLLSAFMFQVIRKVQTAELLANCAFAVFVVGLFITFLLFFILILCILVVLLLFWLTQVEAIRYSAGQWI